MNFSVIATKQTKVAFRLAASLVRQQVLFHSTAVSADYDPATGTPPSSASQTSVGALVLAFKQKDVDGTVVKAGDERLLVKATDIAGFVPGTDDWLVEAGTGTRRDIIGVTLDAARSIYTLHCRREVQT